jgi:formiminoglutamase
MRIALGECCCYGQKVSGWPNISDLVVGIETTAPVGLVGAPLAAGSVTPGQCDLAPALLRQTLRRIGRYDVETRRELSTQITDRGDVEIAGLSIEEATGPISEAVRMSAALHQLTLLVGGNNAVTRPGLHGLGVPLEKVGLITLDAHFDMRDTYEGLSNGNPVRALIQDGLPGANIAQIGLASFANSRKMHEGAAQAGNLVVTISEVRRLGVALAVDRALEHVGQCGVIVVDCDIDVIDRSQFPAAPGARPGGMAVQDFFAAVRRVGLSGAADRSDRVGSAARFDRS